MLRIYLFACYLVALANASPIAYSDKNLVNIDRLRASGASEVFYLFPFHLYLCPLEEEKRKEKKKKNIILPYHAIY